MSVQLTTADVSYKGRNVLDVRSKVGNPIFTPPMSLILDKMNERISLTDFVLSYLMFLNESVQEHPKKWLTLLRSREVVIMSDRAYIRATLGHFLVKMGAFLNNEEAVLTSEMVQMIADFEITKHQAPAKPEREMVVDPLAVNTVQSSTCTLCRQNRTASAWTPQGYTTYTIVEDKQVDPELGSRNQSCCAHSYDAEGKVNYVCPIFQYLINGYKAGVTSQGTNLNPCKNCTEHVDNGGTCFGDRCPDGVFDIKPGAGLVKC